MIDTCTVRVHVADYAVATTGTISTIGLGSCVAIILHDPVAKIGGLAHVLLPAESMSRDRSNPAKFPATVLPILVGEMLSLGAVGTRMRAKIVGGASMFGQLVNGTGINVGERNIAATKEALAAAGIPLIAEDTGLDYGRSVYFHLDDGRVEVRSLKKGDRVI
jgi:chemotaxis protein CheD